MNADDSIRRKLSTFLAQPYPFYYQGKILWIFSGCIFLMNVFFGYFFEPFNVYVPEHKMDYFWITVIHSAVPVALVGILSFIKITSKIEENWKVGKELLLVAFYLLLIGVVQFLIRDIIYDNPNNWSWRYLYEEVRNTFLVGTLFMALLVSLNFNRLNRKHNSSANIINSKAIESTVEDSIRIATNVKSDELHLDVNNLLFAKAEGNYVLLFIKGESIKKELKRIPIKELQAILQPYNFIVKTHRSYLVNLFHVKNVSGNAQGYKLQLADCEESVPVSRNMIDQFDMAMKGI